MPEEAIRRQAPPWTPADLAAAVGWFGAALVLRLPFLTRIEGALDHDQSVVGLMALDIAAGRRFPIFFDGQRYMGALEAYVAAGFVRAFGHEPWVVALAPWLFFGLFVAGQFAVWRTWCGRPTAHLAAALTLFGSPLITVWALVPRGGYVEALAWALPTLAAYRAVTRPGAPPLTPVRQAAWGFWLALGYFLNPLSMTVYVTMALDWTFGRHGDDLRRERPAWSRWPDGPAAFAAAMGLGLMFACALAVFCHVDPRKTEGGIPYVFLVGISDAAPARVLGALGSGLLLLTAGWLTRLPARLHRNLVDHPWTLVGVALAWSPIVLHTLLVRLGRAEDVPSLPAWIRAPWASGENLRHGVGALGTLVGSDPRAVASLLIGQGVAPPAARWPVLSHLLVTVAPAVVLLAVGLVARAAWVERRGIFELASVRGHAEPTPARLALLSLAVSAGLYAFQATSSNSSSVRYLVFVWVALPGVLAVGLRSLPARGARLVGGLLLGAWVAAQGCVWVDMDRTSDVRPLVAELERRGVRAVVATTPVALITANLAHGRIGVLEYQAIWPRLSERYLDRFKPGAPVVCVTDRNFPWSYGTDAGWAPAQDLARHLRGLAKRHPGRVRPVGEVGDFTLWEADLGLSELLAAEPTDGPAEPGQLAASAPGPPP